VPQNSEPSLGRSLDPEDVLDSGAAGDSTLQFFPEKLEFQDLRNEAVFLQRREKGFPGEEIPDGFATGLMQIPTGKDLQARGLLRCQRLDRGSFGGSACPGGPVCRVRDVPISIQKGRQGLLTKGLGTLGRSIPMSWTIRIPRKAYLLKSTLTRCWRGKGGETGETLTQVPCGLSRPFVVVDEALESADISKASGACSNLH